MTRHSPASLLLTIMISTISTPTEGAIGPTATVPELTRAIEARLVELFAEKDPLASDHAVMLASRYQRLRGAPRPDGEQRAALTRLFERASAPPPKDVAYGALGKVAPPELVDGGDRESLKAAVAWALEAARQEKGARVPFGMHTVRRGDLVASLELFRRLLDEPTSAAQLARAVAAQFDVYRSPGLPPSGDVLYTGYHDPLFRGRLKRDDAHRWPVYREPRLAGVPNERHSRGEVARGALAGRGLEIVWLRDPLDAYLLEIQGSGVVQLGDGRHVRVEFAAKNGHPYRSLGKTMVRMGLLKPWEMSIPGIRRVLGANPSRLREVLDTNPSQIYFRGTVVDGAPAKLIYLAQRSVACDQTYFPRAAVGFVALERPDFGADGSPRGFVTHRRFVVNHDTGSAIRGPGHIDLYWGRDAGADHIAGSLREPGELYYFLKRGTMLAPRK
jgi:membrane-bound lytic murein transglycosylase A